MRNGYYPASAVLFSAILALVLSWVSFASMPRDFHPAKITCQTCHLASEVTPDNAHQLLASQEQLCGACHSGAMQLSHPSGFSPGRPLAKQYPLDWKGDVTCSTCHNIHRGDEDRVRGAKTGRIFCLACHNESFFSAMIDQGHSIQRLGHLAAGMNQSMLNLDAYSRQCLGCHMDNQDGSTLKLDRSGVVRHGGGSANHPIGMRYSDAVARGLYHRASRLNPAILLPEGKVSCVSCHVGYSKDHGALVVSNVRSALCLECHDT